MGNIWGYILSATIYGSITGVVILLIKKLLRNKINKKYAYLLWMILIIKLVIPFGPESSLSLFNKIPIKINKQTSVTNNTSTSNNSFSYTVDNDYSTVDNSINNDLQINENTSSIVNQEKINIIFKNIFPYIWLSGVVMALTTHIIIYLYFIRHLKKNGRYYDERLKNILKNCKKKLHIKRKIYLVIDDTINSPSLVGIFKIRIVLPSNLVDLNEEELQHIFLHELSHYKNKDTWVDNALAVLQCVHWFNPLVWYLFKHVRNDMEMACDERVLGVLNERDYNKYGLTMLTVLEKANFNKKYAVGLNMADDKKIIKKRVELIKNSKHLTSKKKKFTITGIICLLVMCGVLLTNGKTINKDESTLLLPIEKMNPQYLDESISKAIIENYVISSDTGAEFNVESHVILGKNEYDNFTEVYVVSTYGGYSFENNIFNLTNVSSNIPIRIKFSKNKEGYELIESEVAKDGSMYKDSILDMFPKKEAYLALNNDYTNRLLKEVNKQAKAYVESINRKCEVTYNYVEKEYIEELALVDSSDMQELWDYPEWIGNREVLENGKRYIYETQYDKSLNILTFIKLDENNTQIEMLQYEIGGNKLEKLNLK